MSQETTISPELRQIIKEFVNDLSRTFQDKMNNELYKNIDGTYNSSKKHTSNNSLLFKNN